MSPEDVPTEWVEKAAAVLRDSRLVNVCGDGRGCRCEEAVEYSLVSAHDMLAAALDVEEMARVLHREGAWCGVCEYEGWDACRECRETVTGYATVLRTAILGGAGMSAREALREMRERAEAIDEPGLDSNQYREALESSAADLPALVGALEAVLEKHRDYDRSEERRVGTRGELGVMR